MSSIRDLPADVPALLRELLGTDPGRPRVTWYGPDYERVEFSAKTLDNWVSKTANLLVDELDVVPGSLVGLALPAHWRTVVWLLAGWSVGAHVVVLEESSDHTGDPLAGRLDVLVTDRPSSPPTGTVESQLVVVALPSLATRFAGDVPTGALDAAAEVRLQPDVFVPGARPAPGSPALTVDGASVSYADLFTSAPLRSTALDPAAATPASAATGSAAATPASAATPAAAALGVRLLTSAGPAQALRSYLAPLAAGGSIVLHHDLSTLTDAERAHLADQENVTALDV